MSNENINLAAEITKVKPYTVYDLSTRSVLSDDEITKCLKEASQKEYLKKIGEYGLNDDFAKPNGDAPNFMILPPKKRSKSFSALPTQYDTITENKEQYDDLPFRARSNTAPALCLYEIPTVLKESKRNIFKASRLVQPSSPGSAKRKVQQKLQRDAKQQIATPRSNTSGIQSPLVKPSSKLASSKITSTSIPRQNGMSNIPNKENTNISTSKLKAPETKRSIPSAATKKLAQPASRAQQSGLQRSIVPRLSQKNSDASSSDTNSDSGSCRSTPVSGGVSPLNELTHANSTLSVTSSDECITTKQSSGIPAKKTIPSRASSALENKRSLDSLRMSRENTAESFAKRKISASSIPRGKQQSCENLHRENTSDSLHKVKGLQKPSTRRSSVGSTSEPTLEKTTLAATYGSKLSYSSSTSKIRQTTTTTTSVESISRPTKLSTSSLPSSVDKITKNNPINDKAITVTVNESDMKERSDVLNLDTDARSAPVSKLRTPGTNLPTRGMSSPVSSRKNILKPPSGSTVGKTHDKLIRKSSAPPQSKLTSPSSSIHPKHFTQTEQRRYSDADKTNKPKQLSFTKQSSLATNTDECKQQKEMNDNKNSENTRLRFPTVGKLSPGLSSSNAVSKLPQLNSSTKNTEILNENIEIKNTDNLTREIISKNENNENDDDDIKNIDLDLQPIDSSPTGLLSPSNNDNTASSPLYKLDIPSPDSNPDSISYPYDSLKFTHQNVEMIISERQQTKSCEANNIKLSSDGYAEPDDRVKTNTTGYGRPLDTLKHHDDEDDTDEDEDDDNDDDNVNNEKIEGSIISKINDPFELSSMKRHLTDDIDRVASPFKHIQPKLYIPPPQLNSVSADGALAPVPNEYMRTPSTDVEDVISYSFEMDEIRKRAHQQAIKAWKKNNKVLQEDDGDNDVSGDEGMTEIRERLDTDVFYPTENKDQNEKFVARTSIRRASDEDLTDRMTGNIDDNYPLQTMTLGRDKKKKSKIKKFFQKLSSKKDGKEEMDILEIGRPTIEDFRTSISSYTAAKTRHCSDRRKSDGTISLHSIHDSFAFNATPSTKRRYLFNLNFLRKSRRQRSHTCSGDVRQEAQKPSATVRALCSPDIERRNRIIQTRLIRPDSEPTLFRVNQRLSQTEQTLERGVNQPLRSSSKKYKAPQPPAHILPYAEMTFRPRVSNSSVSSNDDEASYINYPFSKTNISPPKKPERQRSKGSCSEATDHRSRSTSNSTSESKKSNEGSENWKKDFETAVENLNKSSRLSSNSSDSSSALSSESLSSSARSNTLTIETSYNTPQQTRQTTSSLRRTPLRHSIDSYNKLIEVHRQTVEKIAYETSRLTCSCEKVQAKDWDGFERCGEHIQLGLMSYIISPVVLKQDNETMMMMVEQQRKYTAWLQLNQPASQTITRDYLNINYSKSTLHRNCLHICHTIQQDTSEQDTSQQNDLMPKAIQISNVYVSPQTPKMTLNKYASLTLEKHSRYPELYEKETAMILLQIVKGLQHYYQQGVFLSSLQTENIFILHNGEPSVTLSPRKQPNKCPAIAIGVLPTLGNCFEKSEYTSITNLCHHLAFVLFELLHTPYHDELKDAVDISMLLTTLPDLTIKSIYSRYLQFIINLLLGTCEHSSKTFDDLRLMLEVILFGPTDISDHSEDDAILLINKWHNRRCVDMVTHILKEASLIVLCASGVGQDLDKMKNVEQELLLECEFLADATAPDIYRIAKLLNR